jgi:hypothetical protein
MFFITPSPYELFPGKANPFKDTRQLGIRKKAEGKPPRQNDA